MGARPPHLESGERHVAARRLRAVLAAMVHGASEGLQGAAGRPRWPSPGPGQGIGHVDGSSTPIVEVTPPPLTPPQLSFRFAGIG